MFNILRKLRSVEGWHTRRLTCICFQALRIQELLSTLNVELLIDISGSFIVLLIFRIIFSVLFQVLLSVLPLVTFVPYFFIYIRPIASRTMLLLRREECCEVFCRLFSVYFVFVLDVSLVTRVLLWSVYRSRLIRICVNRFLSVIIFLMGLSTKVSSSLGFN